MFLHYDNARPADKAGLADPEKMIIEVLHQSLQRGYEEK